MIVDGFHLELLGGDSMNRVVVAGAGGVVAVNRTTVTIDNTRIIARGGDSVQDVTSTGGAGATVSFSGAALVDVDPGVQILSRGGHSGLETVLGGNGGNFRAVLMDLFATLVFDGSANIRGGRTVTAREGDLGAYCVSGAISSQTEANIIGLNTFAPCRCNDATVESLADVTNELDNLDSTIRPDTLITETNVLSVRAFRIDPDLTVDMEISVNGTASTDIDISVADGDFLATVRVCGLPVLDLRLPANYFDAAAAAPHGANIEILTIGAGSRAGVLDGTGSFFLLVAVEFSGTAGDFTVTIES